MTEETTIIEENSEDKPEEKKEENIIKKEVNPNNPDWPVGYKTKGMVPPSLMGKTFKKKGDPESERRWRQPKRKKGNYQLSNFLHHINRMTPEKRNSELVKLASDSNYSSLEILKLIEKLKNHPQYNKFDLRFVIEKMIEAHKAIHGTKSKNVNVNIELDSWLKMNEKEKQAWKERTRKFLQEKPEQEEVVVYVQE